MGKSLQKATSAKLPAEAKSPSFDPGALAGTPGLEGFSNSDLIEMFGGMGLGPAASTAKGAMPGGGGGALPHQASLESSFGRDLGGIDAHVGGEAASANEAMGSEAFATGTGVAFAESPDLWTAAHETAHALDPAEPSGGESSARTDPSEQHADAVADAVVAGESVADQVGDGPVPDKKGVSMYKTEEVNGEESKVGTGCDVIKPTAYSQDLYATQSKIDEANGKLEGAGKDGSFITLLAEDGVDHKGKNLKKVVPTFMDGETDERNGQHAGLKDPNQGGKDTMGKRGDELALWSDCGRSSAAVTGSQGGDRQAMFKDRGREKSTKGKANDGSVSDWLDTEPGNMANDIYWQLMPKFMARPTNKQYLVKGVHYETVVDYTGMVAYIRSQKGLPNEHDAIKTPANIVEAKSFYAKMTADGQDKFDKEAGINHYANPEIGETYSMATEGDMPGFETTEGTDVWNYHWAGVVMKDGSDNVTLENYAVTAEYAKSKGVRQGAFVNREWNFEMYGTEDKDQTFHQEHLDTATHGSKATSMRIQTQK